MSHRIRRPGEFCWINILTPQPDAAREFFGSLLGWTYGEIPGMGHLIKVTGRDVGGMFDLESPQTPPGTPPGIGVMVKVTDADGMAARFTELGGSARRAFDIGDRGRMADCTDPLGAGIDIWQPYSSHGMDVTGAEIGAPTWFETMTTDTARATDFYSALFGWTAEPMAVPGIDYTTFSLDGDRVGGMMAITPDMGAMPPHWGVYFTVQDVDASAARAVELGGSITVPATDIPGTGRFAGVISPQGVHFYVFTATAP